MLPLAGCRYWNGTSTQYYDQNVSSTYWSSSPSSGLVFGAYFAIGGGNIANALGRNNGLSVRCVHN